MNKKPCMQIPEVSEMPEDEKERQIKEASNRITEGEVRVLGALAYLGHLAE